MEDEIKKYEIISKVVSSLIVGKTLVFTFLFSIVIYLNTIIKINKIWNFCFLFPVLVLYLACIILHIISVFRVGLYNEENIEKKNRCKSNLAFSANIVFLVGIFSIFMYYLLSIILFS